MKIFSFSSSVLWPWVTLVTSLESPSKTQRGVTGGRMECTCVSREICHNDPISLQSLHLSSLTFFLPAFLSLTGTWPVDSMQKWDNFLIRKSHTGKIQSVLWGIDGCLDEWFCTAKYRPLPLPLELCLCPWMTALRAGLLRWGGGTSVGTYALLRQTVTSCRAGRSPSPAVSAGSWWFFCFLLHLTCPTTSVHRNVHAAPTEPIYANFFS